VIGRATAALAEGESISRPIGERRSMAIAWFWQASAVDYQGDAAAAVGKAVGTPVDFDEELRAAAATLAARVNVQRERQASGVSPYHDGAGAPEAIL